MCNNEKCHLYLFIYLKKKKTWDKPKENLTYFFIIQFGGIVAVFLYLLKHHEL